MHAFNREDIPARLRNKVADGKPVIGGGAGTGISAKLEEAGGIDLIVIYNSGRFRMWRGGVRCIVAQTAVTLEDSARLVQQMCDAAKRVNKDVLVLCHGGPVAEPADAQYVLDHTEGVAGFYGASSMERLPVEPAITGCVRQYTSLRIGRG